jgi:hypothetical protein
MAYARAGTGRWAWLKAVGTAEEPLEADWRAQDDRLLDRVWFSKHPRSIRSGDILAYYAARHGVMPALVEVASDHVDEDLQAARFKWSMAVRPIVCVGLRDAPALQDSPVDTLRVRRQSHIKLDESEYEAIRKLLLKAAADSLPVPLGD